MRVLDVGCGIGLNGAFARHRGAIVTGIEPNAQTREIASKRLHAVLDADIEDDASVAGALSGRTFDVMLFGDVLEHTRDPVAVLRRLLPYLEDEGHVVVSLPNVAAWPIRLQLLRGTFEYGDSGILDRTHLRFFTRDTAETLLKDVGLEVMRADHNPMFARAAKDLILPAMRGIMKTPDGGVHDPTALARSLPYKLYMGLVRPLEDVAARAAPGLFAFQHVLVARKPPRPRPLRLTIGMLTMDEEASVAKMIDAVVAQAPDARILIVDSSTRDRTCEIARKMGVSVLRQVPPRGHGPAMELLMYTAAQMGDALIYLDCDFTYPPAMIPVLRRMLEMEAIDVVNCARTRSRPRAMPVPNYLANRAFAALAHAAHGVPTVDVHSGMRAYRSSVIRAFDFDGEGDALPIDTLLWPAKCGYRVVELPIEYDERVGTSKLRKLAGTVWTFARLARTLGVGTRGAARFEPR
ncbi:MAG: methyltransferase domain-containing protein [Polyangiaceae bacterium]|nr:methyltransferase domain-containing protein [Polyangiaceae bacterium]